MRWHVFPAAMAILGICVHTPTTRGEHVEIPLRNEVAGTYYISGALHGLGTVEFLVDTGSGYTTITSDMLNKLAARGSAVFQKDLVGEMADGSRLIVPVYRIPEIRLGTCIIRDIDAAVLTSATRPILGMRSLSKVSPFTFSTDPPALQLSQCNTS